MVTDSVVSPNTHRTLTYLYVRGESRSLALNFNIAARRRRYKDDFLEICNCDFL